MAVPTRANGQADQNELLRQVIDQLGELRRSFDTLSDRVASVERALAAHPPAEAAHDMAVRVRVLETRQADVLTRLSAVEMEQRTLREGAARNGVTLKGVHFVAAGAFSLILLAVAIVLGLKG